MCGICGVYKFRGTADDALPLVKGAIETLSKRGPEVQATYCNRNVVLGHSRLSIIDTTDAANQPFSDQTGRYTLVFNGEIYNFRQLKSQLVANGVTFRTQSDTEVLLHWLIQKGPQGMQSLQGFFAFALYDQLDGSFLLARDRFGIKPLLYHHEKETLCFASEMKALVKLGIPKAIDRESLQMYFQLNYIPAPWSIYEGVEKLMPGHYLTIQSGKIQTHQYYDIPAVPLQQYRDLTYDRGMVLLREKMEEAVVKRLVSDVPLGAFLSGGIDSSIIVALASRHVNQLKTFSIGFKDEPMFDETQYAQSVARMHKTDHTVFMLTTADLLNCVNQVLEYTDEPFADSSALAVYVLSRETRDRVTVALSGDGADEMFGGYNKHMAHYKARYPGLDAQFLRIAQPMLSHLPQSRSSYTGNKIRQMARFGEGMGMSDANRYWRWAAFSDENYPSDLLLQHCNEANYGARKSDLIKYVAADGSLNGILRNDMHLVLTNDMLTKVDMMSMANSLEVRVPFLDHEVVNLVFSMPEAFKIDRTGRKKILRDAFRNVLPPELYTRPKQGFEVPLLSWFRRELKDKILNDWLSDDFVEQQGLFNPVVVKSLKKRLLSSNPGEIHAQIWGLIVFQHWYKNQHS